MSEPGWNDVMMTMIGGFKNDNGCCRSEPGLVGFMDLPGLLKMIMLMSFLVFFKTTTLPGFAPEALQNRGLCEITAA